MACAMLLHQYLPWRSSDHEVPKSATVVSGILVLCRKEWNGLL
jgi:hypothetical protein